MNNYRRHLEAVAGFEPGSRVMSPLCCRYTTPLLLAAP